MPSAAIRRAPSCRPTVSPVARSMKSAHTLGCFGPAAQMMAGQDVVSAQSFERGVQQDLLKRAAMDRELRPFVSGRDAARLAPDRLAVLGKVSELLRAHAAGVEPVEQPEFRQLADRVWKYVDADPERLQLGYAFEHLCGNADLMQAQRQRQSADAATGNKHGHDMPLINRVRS